MVRSKNASKGRKYSRHLGLRSKKEKLSTVNSKAQQKYRPDDSRRKKKSRRSEKTHYHEDDGSVSSYSYSRRKYHRSVSERSRRRRHKKKPKHRESSHGQRRHRGRRHSYSESSESETSFSSYGSSEDSFSESSSSYSDSSDETSTRVSYSSVESRSHQLRLMDTLDNSESKLQNIGHVLRAPSIEEQTAVDDVREEQEEMLDTPSQLESRNELREVDECTNPSEFSVRYNDKEHGGCCYHSFFCMDDESFQGSYGGLRNGDILIASSTISSHDSFDLPQTVCSSEHNAASDCQEKQSLISIESSDLPPVATEEARDVLPGTPTGSANMESETGEDEQPVGVSCFNCWGTNPKKVKDGTTQAEITSSDSNMSRTVVWERSFDGSFDSAQGSVAESRAIEIARKARAENVLSKFKSQESPPSTLEVSDDGRDRHFDYQDIFILGDNAQITGVTELEAGNGDTAFFIFLKASQQSLSRQGRKIAASKRRAKIGVSLAPTVQLEQGSDSDSKGVPIMIIDDNKNLVPSPPRLIMEEKALLYIENLGKLSEASYHCLDRKTRKNVTKMVRVQQEGRISNLQIESAFSATTSESEDEKLEAPLEGAQYMFCMHVEDMFAFDSEKIPEEERAMAEKTLAVHETPFDETTKTNRIHTVPRSFSRPRQNARIAKKTESTRGLTPLGNAIHEQLAERREQKKKERASPVKTRSRREEKETVVDDAMVKKYLEEEIYPRLSNSQTTSYVDESEVDQYLENVSKSVTSSRSPGHGKGKNCDSVNEFPAAAAALANGMSRSTAKAHALLQTRKNRNALKAIGASGSGSSPNQKSAHQKTPMGSLSKEDCVHGSQLVASTQQPSKDATRLASHASSESDNSSGIGNYLNYLEGKDESRDSKEILDHGEKAVIEAKAILMNRTLPDEDSGAEETAERVPKPKPLDRKEMEVPIPTHVAQLSSSKTKKEATKVTSQLTGDQQSLLTYAERNRLAQQILLADHSGRPHRTATAYKKKRGKSQVRILEDPLISVNAADNRVEKSAPRETRRGTSPQAHSLSSTSTATANASRGETSTGRSSEGDEFFDAVSRNSDLSVD